MVSVCITWCFLYLLLYTVYHGLFYGFCGFHGLFCGLFTSVSWHWLVCMSLKEWHFMHVNCHVANCWIDDQSIKLPKACPVNKHSLIGGVWSIRITLWLSKVATGNHRFSYVVDHHKSISFIHKWSKCSRTTEKITRGYRIPRRWVLAILKDMCRENHPLSDLWEISPRDGSKVQRIACDLPTSIQWCTEGAIWS